MEEGNGAENVDQYIKFYPLLAVISRLLLSYSTINNVCNDNYNSSAYKHIVNMNVLNLIQTSLKVSKEFMLLPTVCILQQRTRLLMSLFY